MRVYTAHIKQWRAPVLVPEGFAWGGLVFGPLWLLAQRAWVAAVLSLCLAVAILLLAPPALRLVLSVGLDWLIGLFGRDLVRWSLEQDGYHEAHVVAAQDADAALARLLDRRPDLIADAVGVDLAA